MLASQRFNLHPHPRSPLSQFPSPFSTMASKAAQKRLTKEYISMQKEPPPFVWAVPDEKNILTCQYGITLSCAIFTSFFNPYQSPNTQRGPPDSPFADGEYHGVLIFPSEYPFKPPGIKVAYSHFSLRGHFQIKFPPDVHTVRTFSTR
ncbi:hypothetical protein J3R83DRAFT_8125 [Lanmaoa asiatica]|nr:hypothetical protein J3R83DRAFT_8125 [Lanmaoa asiatica]